MTGLRDNPEPPRSTRFEIALENVTDADVGAYAMDNGDECLSNTTLVELLADTPLAETMRKSVMVLLTAAHESYSSPAVVARRCLDGVVGRWINAAEEHAYNRIAASIAESRCERGLVIG